MLATYTLFPVLELSPSKKRAVLIVVVPDEICRARIVLIVAVLAKNACVERLIGIPDDDEIYPAVPRPMSVDVSCEAKKVVETKVAKFAVETRFTRLAVETRDVRLAVETTPLRFALEMYPADPRPTTVEVSSGKST